MLAYFFKHINIIILLSNIIRKLIFFVKESIYYYKLYIKGINLAYNIALGV